MKTRTHFSYLLIAMLITAFFSGCSTTAPAPESTAADWRFHDIVDTAFVQQYAKVPMAENVMIIDARAQARKI